MYTNEEDGDEEDDALLMKTEHAKFVMKSMMKLPRGMVGQDGGQPWFLFWNTQTL